MVIEASESVAVAVPSETEHQPAVYCAHCGLPVPPGLIDDTQEYQFCCSGCRTVYKVIHGCGLDRFYKLRESADAKSAPAQTTDRQYGEFDDPVFHDLYIEQSPDETLATELYLEGVHCAACVWLVEKLPQVLPGVVEARLDMRRSLLRVRWDTQQVSLSRIARMLDSLGYPPHPARDKGARELRSLAIRFGAMCEVPSTRSGNLDGMSVFCLAITQAPWRPLAESWLSPIKTHSAGSHPKARWTTSAPPSRRGAW